MYSWWPSSTCQVFLPIHLYHNSGPIFLSLDLLSPKLVMPICVWISAISSVKSWCMYFWTYPVKKKKETTSPWATHQLPVTLHLQPPPWWNDSLPSFVQVFPGNSSCFTACHSQKVRCHKILYNPLFLKFPLSGFYIIFVPSSEMISELWTL